MDKTFLVSNFSLVILSCCGATPRDLRTGVAGHAFDHLGTIGDQAETAAASGANIIYVSGLGVCGYQGLPSASEIQTQRVAAASYLREAKRHGIRLAIGYVCATSIVKLDTFDKNWPPVFRTQFHTAPADWRQQDRNGKPLPSWYGGDYQPACMNNPDWRTYERFMVRQQLESGCDGIFFDNPTVHPQGCYCPWCMEKFADFLKDRPARTSSSPFGMGEGELESVRDYAARHPADFMRFRSTTARDFLAHIRSYARTIKHGALITANNSLNSADVLFSQCRTYGYDIYEMSQAEDLVVVEDMSRQPRVLPSGQAVEYSPTYKQLHAISHGKPVVAVTIADADYHTPPRLVRLAMAEAAANDASYLSWPTWPEKERARMISAIRPEADFLKRNSGLLNDTVARRDVVLFLPFRKWLVTDQCKASRLAAEMTRANVQYQVICEDDLKSELGGHAASPSDAGETLDPSQIWRTLPPCLRGTKTVLVETVSDFTATEQKIMGQFSRAGGSIITSDTPSWLKAVQAASSSSLSIEGPANIRALVRDQKKRTIVHLLNLNVQRLSSFEDKATPASQVRVRVRVPFRQARSVRALTADPEGTSGSLEFSTTRKAEDYFVETTLQRLEIASILVIE